MAKRNSTKGQPAPEVLPALSPLESNPDLQEVTSIATGVTTFLAGMRAFFAKAALFENEAKRRRETALGIKTVTTVEEQSRVQALALETRNGKSAIAAHWKPIADVTNRLHKCITGGRGRAEKMEDEAFAHLNTLNNRFNAEQEAKARAEEKRLRDEAEARERQRIADEAAELERVAAEQEAASPELSARELAFLNQVIKAHGEMLLEPNVTLVEAELERLAVLVGYRDGRYGVRLWDSEKFRAALRARIEAERTRRQAAAVAAAPVVVHVEEVKAETASTAGTATRWKAKVTNRAELMAAVKAGAVPDDVFMVDLVKLGQYATALKGAMNHWPGVEAWDDTRMRR
jgi:hypothetical protein